MGNLRTVPAHDAATATGRAESGIRLWWTRRALLLHLTVVVVVPVFSGLFWWQVQRVREGNTLSWAYVFEWPIFTAYAMYLWWKLIHDQGGRGAGVPVAGRKFHGTPLGHTASRPCVERQDRTEQEDEELLAYNRYLAELNTSGRRKSW